MANGPVIRCANPQCRCQTVKQHGDGDHVCIVKGCMFCGFGVQLPWPRMLHWIDEPILEPMGSSITIDVKGHQIRVSSRPIITGSFSWICTCGIGSQTFATLTGALANAMAHAGMTAPKEIFLDDDTADLTDLLEEPDANLFPNLVAPKDGEVTCPKCQNKRLNRTDSNCWRCGYAPTTW